MAGPASPSSLLWPEIYGFYIYGNGPSYVIYVEPTSISETAGIRVGDRIIEIDGQDVSNQPASVIKFIARNSKNSPPPISVQSFSKTIEITPDLNLIKTNALNPYGLTIRGDMPVIIDHVVDNSPAYLAGIRPGDVIVEVNQKQLKYSESLRPFLTNGTQSKIALKIIPLSKENNPLASTVTISKPPSSEMVSASNSNFGNEWNDAKLKRAQEFYNTMNQIFANEPDKRKYIINELKLFTESGDMQKLTTNLNSVLKTPQQRILLNEIKPFIPVRQQHLFESLTSSSLILNSPSNQQIINSNEMRPSQSQSQTNNTMIDLNKKPTPTTTTNRTTNYSEVILNDLNNDEHGQNQTDKLTRISSLIPTIYTEPKTFRNKSPNLPVGKRRIMIRRSPNESIGITLRGNKPTIVEFVEPNSPAELSGIYPNDVVLSVNDVDVEEKNHRFIVDFLQTTGQNPIFEVIQKSEYDLLNRNNQNSSMEPFDLINNEGKTFKEKVKEVLSPREKPILKKILLDYNNNKDINEFFDQATKLLDTPAKRSLWFFLMPILDESHQDYVQKLLGSTEFNNHFTNSIYSSASSLPNNSKFRPSFYHSNTLSNLNKKYNLPDKSGMRKSKQFGSAPSLLALNVKSQDDDLVMKFAKQLDYLLNPRERTQVKHSLKAYNYDRNINTFLDTIDLILDTPAKRTLWFHIIPLLDEDDQEYCKRKLYLGTASSHYINSNDYYDYDPVLNDDEIDNLFDLTHQSTASYDKFPTRNRRSGINRLPGGSDDEEDKYQQYRRQTYHYNNNNNNRPSQTNNQPTLSSKTMTQTYNDPVNGRSRYFTTKTLEQYEYEYEEEAAEENLLNSSFTNNKNNNNSNSLNNNNNQQVFYTEKRRQPHNSSSSEVWKQTKNDTNKNKSTNSIIELYLENNLNNNNKSISNHHVNSRNENKFNQEIPIQIETKKLSKTNLKNSIKSSLTTSSPSPASSSSSSSSKQQTKHKSTNNNKKTQKMNKPEELIKFFNEENMDDQLIPCKSNDNFFMKPKQSNKEPTNINENGLIPYDQQQPQEQQQQQQLVNNKYSKIQNNKSTTNLSPTQQKDVYDYDISNVTFNRKISSTPISQITIYDNNNINSSNPNSKNDKTTQVNNNNDNNTNLNKVSPFNLNNSDLNEINVITGKSEHSQVSSITSLFSACSTTTSPKYLSSPNQKKLIKQTNKTETNNKLQQTVEIGTLVNFYNSQTCCSTIQTSEKLADSARKSNLPSPIGKVYNSPKNSIKFVCDNSPSKLSNKEQRSPIVKKNKQLPNLETNLEAKPTLSIPTPPLPPPLPPPPAPPLPLFFMQNTSSQNNLNEMMTNDFVNSSNEIINSSLISNLSSNRLNNCSSALESNETIKRVNWEKIENKNLKGTVWEKLAPRNQLNQVIKYLDIDNLFAQKQSTTINRLTNVKNPTEIKVLSPKKAYNIAIVIGSLKYQWQEICQYLYKTDSNIKSVITPELVKHLIQYSPDEEELRNFKSISDISNLTIPDKFMHQLSMIPSFKTRLESLLFVYEFEDKLNELNNNVYLIKIATDQVRDSNRLKNIIEVILVIGNHLNQGNERLGEANAFRINVLPQLDQTKLSSDNSISLMNVLACLCENQYPQSVKIKEDIDSIGHASKISNKALTSEINDLKLSYQTVLDKMESLKSKKLKDDNFRDYIIEQLEKCSSKLDKLLEDNANVESSFIDLVKYFGEDPLTTNSQLFFSILNEFVQKFEKAHINNTSLNGKFIKILGKNGFNLKSENNKTTTTTTTTTNVTT